MSRSATGSAKLDHFAATRLGIAGRPAGLSDLPPSRRRARRDRAVGLAVSILLHVIMLIIGFGTLRGAMVTGGGDKGDEQTAITVTLAGTRGGRRATAADAQDAQLKAILKQIASAEPLPAAPTQSQTPQANLDKLLDQIDHDANTTDPKVGGAGRAQADKGGQGATPDAPDAKTPEKRARGDTARQPGETNGGASSGSLWGQVEPCWRHMPGASNVPVTLDVTLNGRGMVALPPTIIRPSTSAPDEARLIAEARALASITACSPYHPGGLPGATQTIRLNFAPPKPADQHRRPASSK